MRTWKGGTWQGMPLAAAGLLLAVALRAEEPKAKGPDPGRPPGQRRLAGEDARQAKELQEWIDALYAQGAFAEAVEPAERLLLPVPPPRVQRLRLASLGRRPGQGEALLGRLPGHRPQGRHLP